MEPGAQTFSPALQAQVARLCREGGKLAGGGETAMALQCYLDAWELLPEPRQAWDPSTWILAAISELLRRSGGMSDALDILVRASGRTAGAPAQP